MLKINGKKYDIITVDFETYYEIGKDAYSLRNKAMNTSDYIRDERYESQCVSIKKNGQKTKVYAFADIATHLKSVDWSKSALLCHNTAFDGLILSHHYGIVPAFYLDTMSMGRAVHGAHSPAGLDYLAKLHGLKGKVHGGALVNMAGIRKPTKEQLKLLMQYCGDDSDDTYALFNILLEYVPDKELRLIDQTIRMFADPVLLLDEKRCRAEYDREVREKAEALKKVEDTCTLKDLTSNEKFAQLLRDADYEPPMKISPTTGEPAYAFAKTDLEFMEMMEDGPPLIQALCAARVRNKTSTNETRALRFLNAGRNGQKVPVMLNYCKAHTFRWSGGNKMNLQNLMRGGELRRSLLAPKGHVLVVVDSAQIEARTLAWLAGEQRILDAFANKDDVYKLMATSIYGVSVDEVTKDQRFVGKVAVLGLGYGMGPAKFKDTLAKGAMGPKVIISMEEAKGIVKKYRHANAHIVRFWRKAEEILIDMILGREGSYGPLSWGKEWIRMPNGLFMHYRGLTGEIYQDRSDNMRLSDAHYEGTKGAKIYIYGGAFTENIVQSLARIIVGDQMLEIGDQYRLVTMSHDEIVALASNKRAKTCEAFMAKVMRTPPYWCADLPLDMESGYDVCYSK